MPNDNRVFPAGTGGNPTAPQIGSVANLVTTAQPPIRPPPDPFVLKSVEPFVDDDDIPGFVDGQGNRTWHVDTSASAKAITFVSAAESVDFDYVVKWVKGANGLKVVAATGNVGGTTTFVGVVAGDAYQFRSDGTEYHLIGQATNQGFLTSNSFSAFTASASFVNVVATGNLTVGGSATFSQTVAFLTSANISGTLSVNTLVVAGTASFSGTVVMNSLTVLGSASFSQDVYVRGSLNVSATASVGALTIAGAPLQNIYELCGSFALNNVATGQVSGSWSAYTQFHVWAFFNASCTTAGSILSVYASTDNGTTRHLQASITFAGGAAQELAAQSFVMGNGATPGRKSINCMVSTDAANAFRAATTATANAGFINQIGIFTRAVATTVTMSVGMLYVYGLRG